MIKITIDGKKPQEFKTIDEAQEYIDGLVDNTTDGQIVTPLPPSHIHSTQGLVSPKPPQRIALDQQLRLSDLPQEYRDA